MCIKRYTIIFILFFPRRQDLINLLSGSGGSTIGSKDVISKESYDIDRIILKEINQRICLKKHKIAFNIPLICFIHYWLIIP